MVSTAWTSETPRPTGRVTGGRKVCEVDARDRSGPVNVLAKKTERVPSPALRTTRSSQPLPFRSAAMICAGSWPVVSEPIRTKAAVAVGVERDRVVLGVDAGEHRALDRCSATQAMSREGNAGVDRDGRLEGAGLAGDALAIEDVAGPVDDQHIVGAVAVDVGHQRRVAADEVDDAGLCERAVAVVQLHHDSRSGGSVSDGQVEPAVAGEVARRDDGGRSPFRTRARGIDLERAVAVARAGKPTSGVGIGDGQVERCRRR